MYTYSNLDCRSSSIHNLKIDTTTTMAVTTTVIEYGNCVDNYDNGDDRGRYLACIKIKGNAVDDVDGKYGGDDRERR